MKTTSIQTYSWFVVSVAALAASLAHVFIDFHIGLYGASSSEMSPLQAATILLTCLMYAWWTASLAVAYAGSRSGLASVVAITLGWAFLYNGVLAFAAAPPPSDAFPYQDIAHLNSFIFGGLGAYSTWRVVRLSENQINWRLTIIGVLVMIFALAVQGVLALTNL